MGVLVSEGGLDFDLTDFLRGFRSFLLFTNSDLSGLVGVIRSEGELGNLGVGVVSTIQSIIPDGETELHLLGFMASVSHLCLARSLISYQICMCSTVFAFLKNWYMWTLGRGWFTDLGFFLYFLPLSYIFNNPLSDAPQVLICHLGVVVAGIPMNWWLDLPDTSVLIAEAPEMCSRLSGDLHFNTSERTQTNVVVCWMILELNTDAVTYLSVFSHYLALPCLNLNSLWQSCDISKVIGTFFN